MTTEIEEKCQELFETFIVVSPTDALAWVTANFIGLTVAFVEHKGGDIDSDIQIEAVEEGRNVTISPMELTHDNRAIYRST